MRRFYSQLRTEASGWDGQGNSAVDERGNVSRPLPATEADAIRRVHTKKADIVEKNLHVHQELEAVALPRAYEQAVLQLYRSETISEDRALGLLLGTFDSDSLPDLPPAPEGEIWIPAARSEGDNLPQAGRV